MLKSFPVLSLIVIFSLMMPGVFSQQTIDDGARSTINHVIAGEEPQNDLMGRDFYPTLPPVGDVRQVAEFEPMQSVLVRYPFGIPMSLVAEMSEDCHVTTIVLNQSQENLARAQYQAAGVNLDHCEFLYAPSDTYWTRDYGPWFVVNGNHEVGVCNFPYNRSSRPNDNDIPIRVAEYLGIQLYGMDLTHTGGNYMCDGMGHAASSDLVWQENPTLTHAAIDNLVSSYLGIEHYHVLPDPLGEYIKHIDCWGKFLDVDKVLIGEVEPWDPRYDDYEYVADYFAQTPCAYGYNFQVYRVFTPGDYPYTPYTNSLILNRKVFVPITGSQYDDEAIDVYEAAMPGYEVIPVQFSSWENTDALHCRTKGIADTGMLYVRHFPLFGPVPQDDAFEITAEVIPYTEQPLYSDSLLIFYRVNGGSFSTAPLLHLQDHTYAGYIPGQPSGSVIAYYLHAADESGRSVDHPLIGAPDPHMFNVTSPLPDITVNPDSLIYTDATQAIEGQKIFITNETDATLQINEITSEGLIGPSFWWIAPWPIAMPYTIMPGDSLTLTVYVDVIVDNLSEMLEDTLFIESDAETHHVFLLVDPDILSGVEKMEETISMSVYPNPATENVTVRYKMQDARRKMLELYSVSGEIVQTMVLESQAGVNETTIDVSGLPSGIYILKLQAGSQILTRKIVVR